MNLLTLNNYFRLYAYSWLENNLFPVMFTFIVLSLISIVILLMICLRPTIA